MAVDKTVKGILDQIDGAINRFQKNIPGIQQGVFDSLIEQLKDLSVQGGKVLNSVQNLKLVMAIKNKLERLIVSEGYKEDVKNFVRAFDALDGLHTQYFAAFNQKFKPSETIKFIKEAAVGSTLNDLLGQGLQVNVVDKIHKLLLENITTGGSYASLTEQLRNSILTNETGEGVLERYSKTITTDAINQYSAQYHDTLAQDLNFNWGRYVGSNIKTTREFCDRLTAKEWVHRSELPDILKGNIDGHKCKVNKQGLPLGMIPGTTVDNFKIRRGGYNCGHQFFWVPDSAVPENIKRKLITAKKQDEIFVTRDTISKIGRDKEMKAEFSYFDYVHSKMKTTGKADINVDLSGIQKFNLTEEEAKIIFTWTGIAHERINKEIYAGKVSPAISLYKDAMNKVLDKLPDYKGTVVRDFDPPDIPVDVFLKEHKSLVGKNITYDGFVATSKRQNFTWGFPVRYIIESKTGKLIENISANSHENEVVFKTGSIFTVKKVEDNIIYLEEL